MRPEMRFGVDQRMSPYGHEDSRCDDYRQDDSQLLVGPEHVAQTSGSKPLVLVGMSLDQSNALFLIPDFHGLSVSKRPCVAMASMSLFAKACDGP